MKARLKILNKIAQTTTTQTTDAVNQTNSVSGAPPEFTATNYYPSIIIGFTSKNVPWINGLTNVLNLALFYTSNGQVNLTWMKNNNFNIGTTAIPSQDLKNIANFCKVLYQNIYTNLGQNYQQPLNTQQIAEKINILNNNQFLNNLPTTMISGQLQSKLGGNLKTIIKNYLLQIK